MKKAIYPGSFDPVTLGHIDVIRRASKLFDHLIIGVLNNRAKTPLFSVEERVKMLKEVTKDIPNVEVKSFAGLTVDFAKECGANAVVRGLRTIYRSRSPRIPRGRGLRVSLSNGTATRNRRHVHVIMQNKKQDCFISD